MSVGMIVTVFEIVVVFVCALLAYHYATFGGGRDSVGLLRALGVALGLATFIWCPVEWAKLVAGVLCVSTMLIPEETSTRGG